MPRPSPTPVDSNAMGKKLPRWRITLSRKQRGVLIGTVDAATAEKAIKVAIAAYGITDPERQRRLVAQLIARLPASRGRGDK